MAKDVLTADLVNSYGCHACKQQVVEDEFLTEQGRFWCQKQKKSFDRQDSAHVDCPSWTFNGDEELIRTLKEPKLPE